MKILKWLDKYLEETMCVYLFMVFSAIMIINVFMRFVMSNAIPWASDLVLFIFVWFVWFAISYGFKKGAHVNVTFLANKLPPSTHKAVMFLCNLMTLAGFSVLLVAGMQLLFSRSVVGKYGLLINYPMWSMYLCTPVGLTLSMFRIVQNTWILWKSAPVDTLEAKGAE